MEKNRIVQPHSPNLAGNNHTGLAYISLAPLLLSQLLFPSVEHGSEPFVASVKKNFNEVDKVANSSSINLLYLSFSNYFCLFYYAPYNLSSLYKCVAKSNARHQIMSL